MSMGPTIELTWYIIYIIFCHEEKNYTTFVVGKSMSAFSCETWSHDNQ
jgi:hypothetical protein